MSDANKPAVTVDSPEFKERVEAWSGKYHSAIPMVREGWEDAWIDLVAHLDVHVAKAVAAEREACAKEADDFAPFYDAAEEIAAAIRARA